MSQVTTNLYSSRPFPCSNFSTFSNSLKLLCSGLRLVVTSLVPSRLSLIPTFPLHLFHLLPFSILHSQQARIPFLQAINVQLLGSQPERDGCSFEVTQQYLLFCTLGDAACSTSLSQVLYSCCLRKCVLQLYSGRSTTCDASRMQTYCERSRERAASRSVRRSTASVSACHLYNPALRLTLGSRPKGFHRRLNVGFFSIHNLNEYRNQGDARTTTGSWFDAWKVHTSSVRLM